MYPGERLNRDRKMKIDPASNGFPYLYLSAYLNRNHNKKFDPYPDLKAETIIVGYPDSNPNLCRRPAP